MNASNEDAESVEQFLARIASLKDKREKEDEERTRKLEEEILQGRMERKARREERARSLSPTKHSPSPSLTSLPNRNTPVAHSLETTVERSSHVHAESPLKEEEMKAWAPPSPSRPASSTNSPRPLPTPPVGRATSPAEAPKTATSLARSGTLSWQQRPSSRDSNTSRTRPLSNFAAESPPPKPSDQREVQNVNNLSRNQIAESLASKDPTWFRQTADRGFGSAALRKGDNTQDADVVQSSRTMLLPGMSREATAEPEQPPNATSWGNEALSTTYSTRSPGKNSLNERSGDEHRLPTTAPTSAFPTSKAQVLEPPSPSQFNAASDYASYQSSEPPSTPITRSRPSSPTKGLGGFVQSAMMKRSDSVNKRWSVQAASGLTRGDSIASNRGALGGPTGANLTRVEQRATPRELWQGHRSATSSPTAKSRPISSHSANEGFSVSKGDFEQRSFLTTVTKEDRIDMKEGGEDRSEVKNHSSDDQLPVSPTRTIDSRRWSPTKASWLESALSKPESPKLMPSKPDQPSWKTDLQKSKLSKESTGGLNGLNSPINVASPPNLLRSSTPEAHAKPLSVGGMPEGFSSGVVKRPLVQPTNTAMNETPASAKTAADVQESTPLTETTVPPTPSASSAKHLSLGATEFALKSDVDLLAKKEPPALRPKPQTPPKTDFRAALKPRKTGSDEATSAEPEFKSMFGRLKRTETKNYVAPDELKGNIVKGKNALNATGGPQKIKRVDEFKESILQKKYAMKTSISTQDGASHGSSQSKPATADIVLPEAMAKRQLLKKSSISESPTLVGASSPPPPIGPKPAVFTERPQPIKAQHISVASKPAEPSIQHSASSSSVFKRDPPTNAADVPPTSGAEASSTEIPNLQQENSKLAARLNPSLAQFLTRSSSPKLPDSVPIPIPRMVQTAAEDPSNSPSGPLTHMTKARAKGPKRRLPKSDKKAEQATRIIPKSPAKPSEKLPVEMKQIPEALVSAGHKVIEVKQVAGTPVAAKPKPAELKPAVKNPLAIRSQPAKAQQVADTPIATKPKPAIANKSPDLIRVSSPKLDHSLSSPRLEDAATPEPRKFGIASDTVTTGSPALRPVQHDLLPTRPKPSGVKPLSPSTAKVNSKPQSLTSRDSSQKSPPSKPSTKINGLGLILGRQSPAHTHDQAAELTPPPEPAKPSITERWKSAPSASTSFPSSVDAATRSGVPQSLAMFFDSSPKVREKADFDTQPVMATEAEGTQKSKTLNMQIWEINGDGKKQTMPQQQEHILFEECMYLCVHAFQSPDGTKSTETVLWAGDAVADAAVEDAQIFCRKLARENNAKLEVVRQGRETASFFQALGGIIVTRRSKSSSLYMLCGRRHLGHIAFDEVDLDSSNLCSGFPFLVSAKFGKLYLWKGNGSGADELGCARLIGMDLGLTGEIEEISEGDEPSAFFESFPQPIGKHKPLSYWMQKSDQEKCCCKLFRIDLDRPKSSGGFWSRRGSSPPKSSNKALVQEISPFSQRDVDPGNVYLLDAYFEIYVLIGPRAASKSVEFVTACLLAQEMSILAPSLQDRPLMPTCHVVLGDPPPELRAAFRKWQTQRESRPVTIFPLHDVIDALEG